MEQELKPKEIKDPKLDPASLELLNMAKDPESHVDPWTSIEPYDKAKEALISKNLDREIKKTEELIEKHGQILN